MLADGGVGARHVGHALRVDAALHIIEAVLNQGGMFSHLSAQHIGPGHLIGIATIQHRFMGCVGVHGGKCSGDWISLGRCLRVLAQALVEVPGNGGLVGLVGHGTEVRRTWADMNRTRSLLFISLRCVGGCEGACRHCRGLAEP